MMMYMYVEYMVWYTIYDQSIWSLKDFACLEYVGG